MQHQCNLIIDSCCDLPYEDELSLFGAMAQAIEDRTVQA